MVLSRTKKPLKVFIDSSVLIAAAISPSGAGREVINQGFTQQLELYISADVLEETERNLKLKAPQALIYFHKFCESLAITVVKPARTQILKAAKIIESKDVPIIAGAMKSKADFLVSYDRRHILLRKDEIEKEFSIKVATPDEVMKL